VAGGPPPVGAPAEVPDPYYEDNFPEVFDMLEAASRGLLARL
jgi:protein-tyrosine-phosphatase